MRRYPIMRVCKALGISRSNQYQHRSPRPKRYRREEDGRVLSEIRGIAKDRATYGYRRVTGILKRKRRAEGKRPYNHKRIHRLMKMHDLLLPRASLRLERPHEGKVITLHSDSRYCSDIMEIQCWNGEEVHIAFSLDCHDREAMAYVAKPHDLVHEDIMRLMDRTVVHRFGPHAEVLPHSIEWLSDNGPQYIAKETKAYGKTWGFHVRTTPSYSPQSNGASEAFVNTFKRDYVYTHELPDAEAVMAQLPAWFEDYNEVAPHSGLQYLSPREYRMVQKSNNTDHEEKTACGNSSGDEISLLRRGDPGQKMKLTLETAEDGKANVLNQVSV